MNETIIFPDKSTSKYYTLDEIKYTLCKIISIEEERVDNPTLDVVSDDDLEDTMLKMFTVAKWYKDNGKSFSKDFYKEYIKPTGVANDIAKDKIKASEKIVEDIISEVKAARDVALNKELLRRETVKENNDIWGQLEKHECYTIYNKDNESISCKLDEVNFKVVKNDNGYVISTPDQQQVKISDIVSNYIDMFMSKDGNTLDIINKNLDDVVKGNVNKNSCDIDADDLVAGVISYITVLKTMGM